MGAASRTSTTGPSERADGGAAQAISQRVSGAVAEALQPVSQTVSVALPDLDANALDNGCIGIHVVNLPEKGLQHPWALHCDEGGLDSRGTPGANSAAGRGSQTVTSFCGSLPLQVPVPDPGPLGCEEL